jgi:hypothetical protein
VFGRDDSEIVSQSDIGDIYQFYMNMKAANISSLVLGASCAPLSTTKCLPASIVSVSGSSLSSGCVPSALPAATTISTLISASGQVTGHLSRDSTRPDSGAILNSSSERQQSAVL